MFGNSELKETKLKLDIAINIATEIFTGMDPVMRPLYLRKYKSRWRWSAILCMFNIRYQTERVDIS